MKHLQEFCRDKREPDGLFRTCRVCVKDDREKWVQNNIDKVRSENLIASKKYSENHPDRLADAQMRCKYGIGLVEYAAILEKQGGGCAICGAPPSKRPRSDRATLCIDHDHTSGEVRGLLCRGCNHGLGQFADNAEILEKAAAYLRSPPNVVEHYNY
jgi:hypothetical protein